MWINLKKKERILFFKIIFQLVSDLLLKWKQKKIPYSSCHCLTLTANLSEKYQKNSKTPKMIIWNSLIYYPDTIPVGCQGKWNPTREDALLANFAVKVKMITFWSSTQDHSRGKEILWRKTSSLRHKVWCWQKQIIFQLKHLRIFQE